MKLPTKVNNYMINILVFLVMFCFSCSISFADDEKWDTAKEKRYHKK